MVWHGMVWYVVVGERVEWKDLSRTVVVMNWYLCCQASAFVVAVKKDFPHTTDSSVRQNRQQLESKHKLFCRPTGGNDVDQRQEQYRATSMSICECWCWSVFCVDVFNRKKLQNSLNGAGTSRLVDMSTGSRSRWMYRSADGHTDRELRILQLLRQTWT